MSQNSRAPVSNYRPDVDGLRAIAVLLVVGYHAFPMLIPGGFVGVDVFFVISGYLISGIILSNLRRGVFSFSTFFYRRIVRLFPVLLCMLIVSLIGGWLLLLPSEYMQLGKHVVGGIGYIANFMQWSESGYFDGAAETKPLMHLWSLAIEEQFYLIWPLVMFAAYKYKIRLDLIALFLLIGSFILNVAFISSKADTVFYVPLFRFWELMIGAMFAIYSSDLYQGHEENRWYRANLKTLGARLFFDHG